MFFIYEENKHIYSFAFGGGFAFSAERRYNICARRRKIGDQDGQARKDFARHIQTQNCGIGNSVRRRAARTHARLRAGESRRRRLFHSAERRDDKISRPQGRQGGNQARAHGVCRLENPCGRVRVDSQVNAVFLLGKERQKGRLVHADSFLRLQAPQTLRRRSHRLRQA